MTFLAPLYDGKLGYTSWHDRQPLEASINGAGVLAPGALVTRSGTLLSSSISPGQATIRRTAGTNSYLLSGLYQVINDAEISISHAAGDASNPRIDQIYVKVYDSEMGGDSADQVLPIIMPGTPTSGATLDNRSGVTPLSPLTNSILIADVLVPAGAAASSSFTYRDRRPWAVCGAHPPALTRTYDSVAPTSHIIPLIPSVDSTWMYGGGSGQVAACMYLPRAITATKMRWSYIHEAAATTGTYNIGICDASTRLLVSTGSVAFTGVGSSLQSRAETITSTYFDAGIYWVICGGVPAGGNARVLMWAAKSGSSVAGLFPFPNTLASRTTGGITLPTTIAGAAFTDAIGTSFPYGVPAITLTTA